ncbi:MAG: hypothetical protein DMG57_15295 [Acidobacteria bacterium]|nr:MAG: hypothetical protein DMG57_15295 [Acidobacteriota bacterium]
MYLFTCSKTAENKERVAHLVERISKRRDELLTSTLTLAEVLVKPLSVGDIAWAQHYEWLLGTPGVSVLPFDRACARIFAQIGQDRTIAPADAIQLSCAADATCSLFTRTMTD